MVLLYLSLSRVQWWFVPVPYGILIFVYDEIRKLGVRRHPGSKWIFFIHSFIHQSIQYTVAFISISLSLSGWWDQELYYWEQSRPSIHMHRILQTQWTLSHSFTHYSIVIYVFIAQPTVSFHVHMILTFESLPKTCQSKKVIMNESHHWIIHTKCCLNCTNCTNKNKWYEW